MYYIVALGNPGEEYEDTRHNVGWQTFSYCLKEWKLPELVESNSLSGLVTDGIVGGAEVTVLLPTTFMNNSGSAVSKLVTKGEVDQLIVLHDDIDLPFGEIKVGKGRGAGGNNGVQSIIDKLGTNDFVRVRIGIAQKSIWTGKLQRPKGGGQLERFVLKSFSSSEKKQLPGIFEKAQKAIETIVKEGVEKAMNQCN
ncbi:MAG: aminoacyl-tRNA hydrolase [Candidatus Pacebacteria bacterium]|nr:aminoacyl-tRNA hydrolase [Candidatus Paceibacterota bacterium]